MTDQKKILNSLKFYSAFLKTVNEENFVRTPASGGWSLAEVYSHILSANSLSIVAIARCLHKTATLKRRKADWRVRLILFFGRFPPVKYKVPEVLEASVKKISLEEAANGLQKLVRKIEEIDKGFAKFNPHYKAKHPRLGYLDARQWLRFIYVHSKHHERQLKRIAKELG